jgi:hypothetical protein
LSKELNTAGLSFPSPEDGNRYSFRNVVFYSYLEFRTMDKDQKSSDSEDYWSLCCLKDFTQAHLSNVGRTRTSVCLASNSYSTGVKYLSFKSLLV